MKSFAILVASSALLFTAGAASAADTYPDCSSAYNYGWNTSAYYVTASLRKAQCDVTGTEKAEVALARTLGRQRIQPHNTETIKVCFYQGLYQGYVDALATGYADCGDELALVPSVARAAASVFTAMTGGLESVDVADVYRVFHGVFEAPVPSADDCASYLDASTGESGAADELVAAVCRND